MDLTALKSLSLVINLSHNDPSLVAHLPAWKDYAWTEISVRSCSVSDPCRVPRQRWDWHRRQWVDFSYGYDAGGKRLVITLTLTDDDLSDDDNVCVTAAFLDAERETALVFHQNWHVSPGEVVSHTFALATGAAWPRVHSLALGSKQCREGAQQDDDVYARVRVQVGQVAERKLS